MKSIIKVLIAAISASCILFSGCGVIRDSVEQGRQIPVGTLQPVDTAYTGRVTKAAIYFLNGTSKTLTAEVRTIVIEQDTNPAEVAVKELIKGPSNGDLLTAVAPEGMSFDRMEYSRGVANVYLNYTGEAMDPEKKFTLELAITDTVTDLLSAKNVSVFYNGVQSGFYPGIPYGSMTKQTGNLSDLYLQASTNYLDTPIVPGEQGPPVSSPSTDPTTAESAEIVPKVKTIATVLYFLSSDGGYLLPEVREVKYTDGDYVKSIITELGRGSQSTSARANPLASDISLVEDPIITPATGGYRLALNFKNQPARDNSSARAKSLAYASIVYSLTGFIPDITGTEISVNGETIILDAESNSTMVRRNYYSDYVGSSAPVYFADKASDLLLEVSRSMEQDRIWSAKQRLTELINGPLPGDVENARSVVPEGITDKDILYVNIYSDSAYVNLSQNFLNKCTGLSPKAEMLLAYSMVNTITAMDGINKVQFLVEGRQAEALAGSIILTDPFLRNFGIIKESN